MHPRHLVLLGVVGIGVVCAAGLAAAHLHGNPAKAEAQQVTAGGVLYAAHCASCHGAHLEGQADWRRPGADGLLPAPPHDASGHTWQHGDAELYELVAHSVRATAAPGYRTAMPAYEGVLSPNEIRAVIAFIKAQWPPGVRAYQAAQNPGGTPLAALGGDWTFPPTCDLPTEAVPAPTPP